MEEVWKICSRFSELEVSNMGRVRSLKFSRVRVQNRNKNGYLQVCRFPVHVLVLEAFVGVKPDGMVCRHLNDIKTDNRLENLRWGTQVENMADRIANEYKPWKEVEKRKVDRNIVNEEDVIAIRILRSQGFKYKEIAESFGISISAVYRICKELAYRQF